MSTQVTMFLNTETGQMEAWSSIEAFKKNYSDLNLDERNAFGDIIVQTKPNNSPWGKTIGYIQVREVYS